MDTQVDELTNALTPKPSMTNVMLNKFALLKENINTKYVIAGIVVLVVIIGVILYIQYRKNNFSKSSFNNVESKVPQLSKPINVVNSPKIETVQKEPEHIKKLDLTKEEIKEIEDELNYQSPVEILVDENELKKDEE